MSSIARLLFIYALTPLHPGAGRVAVGGGPVDLPIQRDEFGFPTLWSSSLKGVLRSSFELKAKNLQREEEQVAEKAFVRAVFGPEPASLEVSEYSSAISVLDARLLMIPARSLVGVWAYLTSPHLLSYYKTYLEIASKYDPELERRFKELDELIKVIESALKRKGVEANRTALVSDEQCVIKTDERHLVVLNEEEFTADVVKDIAKIWDLLPTDVERRSLVVVTDDVAGRLVKKSLVIQPRVRLDYERKTVAQGGLWDEEYLPQRTLMVSLIVVKQPKQSIDKLTQRVAEEKAKDKNKAEELKEKAMKLLGNLDVAGIMDRLSKQGFAVLGGKETVGKGIAKLLWYA